MRPKYLDHIVVALAAFLVVQLPFLGSGTLPVSSAIVVAVPFLALSTALFWFFWRGHNWARLLTIAYSLLAIAGIQYVPHQSILQQTLTITNAVFSVGLVYWLFRPKVRLYFSQKRAAG